MKIVHFFSFHSNPDLSPSPPPNGEVSPVPPRSNVIVSTSGFEPQVSSKVVEDDRTLSKEDEITASIKAGNASLSVASESSTKTIKPKRKSGGTKVVQPDSEAKSDSSSQKRKAFKPKQGKHIFGINISIHFAIITSDLQ